MHRLWIPLIAAAALAACSKNEGGAGATGASASPLAGEAKAMFDQRCVACHGSSGKGDGAAAAALNPKPRDYTDSAWQASVTDDELAKVIVEGGAGVGKSPNMPPNPDLKDKPDLVKAMVAHIRSFKK